MVRSALVTGAGGFIGSRLVQRLVRDGYRVRAMDFPHKLSNERLMQIGLMPKKDSESFEIFTSDVCNPFPMDKAVNRIDVIFHLAALISIPYSYKDPRLTVETNIEGTLNMLMAAKEHSIPRFVHMSSSEVYGSAIVFPMDEEHPLQGQSPYSASKIGAEKLVESFHLSYGLPTTTIRSFNVYGPRQSTTVGIVRSSRAVVPHIITQLLDGNSVKFGDTHQTRDLSFVDDTVNALIMAAESPEAIGRTMNIGTGVETSMGDLVAMIAKIMGKELDITKDPTQVRPESSEVQRHQCDASYAKKVLGWEPKVSLEDGLERTIKWISDHRDLYAP